jgi:hypothetical protein
MHSQVYGDVGCELISKKPLHLPPKPQAIREMVVPDGRVFLFKLLACDFVDTEIENKSSCELG